jgi:hypothetical protein
MFAGELLVHIAVSCACKSKPARTADKSHLAAAVACLHQRCVPALRALLSPTDSRAVDKLFILVPILLNLKGNLEMNLSLRMSTSVSFAASPCFLSHSHQRRPTSAS